MHSIIYIGRVLLLAVCECGFYWYLMLMGGIAVGCHRCGIESNGGLGWMIVGGANSTG